MGWDEDRLQEEAQRQADAEGNHLYAVDSFTLAMRVATLDWDNEHDEALVINPNDFECWAGETSVEPAELNVLAALVDPLTHWSRQMEVGLSLTVSSDGEARIRIKGADDPDDQARCVEELTAILRQQWPDAEIAPDLGHAAFVLTFRDFFRRESAEREDAAERNMSEEERQAREAAARLVAMTGSRRTVAFDSITLSIALRTVLEDREITLKVGEDGEWSWYSIGATSGEKLSLEALEIMRVFVEPAKLLAAAAGLMLEIRLAAKPCILLGNVPEGADVFALLKPFEQTLQVRYSDLSIVPDIEAGRWVCSTRRNLRRDIGEEPSDEQVLEQFWRWFYWSTSYPEDTREGEDE